MWVPTDKTIRLIEIIEYKIYFEFHFPFNHR